MSDAVAPYGVDPTHPSADLLLALMVERYGDLRRLERERFTPVVPLRIGSNALPDYTPISRPEGDLHAFELVVDLERRDRQIRGDAA